MAPTLSSPHQQDQSKDHQSTTAQQQLRPPLYNPEDYASALRALFTNSLPLPHANVVSPTTLILEHSSTHPPLIPGQALVDMNKHNTRLLQQQQQQQQHNPSNTAPEMGMKKFMNGSELLFKLEADLRSAFPTFTQEFVSGDSDGVACILDALRTVHEALDHVNGLREQRKLVLDERSCMQCVYLMLRNLDSIPKLLTYPHGLYPIVNCSVSTNTSTRVIALEILTSVLDHGGADAYDKVSEAFSTLRLRLGEPIRCKVLVGAISSAAAGVFQAAGVRFFKSFVGASPSSRHRVYLQVELEEAGFNVEVLRKSAELSPARESRLVLQELDEWDRVVIDVDTVVRQNSQLRNSVATLQQEIATLKDRIKKQEPLSSTNVVYATPVPPPHKYNKKKPTNRPNVNTPIQTIVTPVDSEEEAEQIHQILEDLHNIVNNEMLMTTTTTNNTTSTNSSTASSSEIVPILSPITRPLLLPRNAPPPPPHHHPHKHYNNNNRPIIRSEPNLFESSGDSTTLATSSSSIIMDNKHNGDEDSPTRVKDVVQQLENSSVLFNTLPNFNTGGLGAKFANFKSSKLDGGGKNNRHGGGGGGGGWGDDDEDDDDDENNIASSSSSRYHHHHHHYRGGHHHDAVRNNNGRVKSLENLDNFTLKWKYPVVDNNNKHVLNQQQQQPNSLVVLQDYRMNRFGGGGGSSSTSGNNNNNNNNNKQESSNSSGGSRGSPGNNSGGGGGLFSKKKKAHHHPQKTFQISLVNKSGGSSMSDKGNNNNNGGGFINDLSESSGGGGGNNRNNSNGGRNSNSPSMLERVTDLPSGMY